MKRPALTSPEETALEVERKTWNFVARKRVLDRCLEENAPLSRLFSEEMFRLVPVDEWEDRLVERVFSHPFFTTREKARHTLVADLFAAAALKTRDLECHQRLWALLEPFFPAEPCASFPSNLFAGTFSSWFAKRLVDKCPAFFGEVDVARLRAPRSAFAQRFVLCRLRSPSVRQSFAQRIVWSPGDKHVYDEALQVCGLESVLSPWIGARVLPWLPLHSYTARQLADTTLDAHASDILQKMCTLCQHLDEPAVCFDERCPEAKCALWSCGFGKVPPSVSDTKDIWLLWNARTRHLFSRRAKTMALGVHRCLRSLHLPRDVVTLIADWTMSLWVEAERTKLLGESDCRELSV